MEIRTERLLITDADDEVIDARLIGWLNDKKLMRWSEQRYRHHDENTQLRFLTDAYARGNPFCFDIYLREIPDPAYPAEIYTLVGTLHAHLDRRHKRADLGIMLGPEYHDKGYAREAWQAIELWLCGVHNIRKFEGGCASGNLAMLGLFERLGYVKEGTRPVHFMIDGETYDLVQFGKRTV